MNLVDKDIDQVMYNICLVNKLTGQLNNCKEMHKTEYIDRLFLEY